MARRSLTHSRMARKMDLTAIGLMSGTSLDGIDAAVVRTDGEQVLELGPALFIPYTPAQRKRLRDFTDLAQTEGEALKSSPVTSAVEHDLTLMHARAVDALLQENGLSAGEIDLVGFHGQTILHSPDEGWTWQIGSGDQLAVETGIPVINDFRTADVEAGGEGAPLAPLYHCALLRSAEVGQGDWRGDWPIVVLNIGGVANVTWIGENGDVLAFDTGPGNSLIDDWVRARCGQNYDEDGLIARQGRVDSECLERLMSHPYFERKPPKSADRSDFSFSSLEHLGLEDGAATLNAYTVASICRSVALMPSPPGRWLACGGGRKNVFLMEQLGRELAAPIDDTDSLGWRGDFLEAEAFAFLAVRSSVGLPLSLPTTTGVSQPCTGGVRCDPAKSS